METSLIQKLVDEAANDIIADRRYFHEYPELSGKEVNTAKYIKYEMAKLGMAPNWICGGNSAYYELDTGRAGKTLALRADIDALPIMEDECNLKNRKMSVSKNPGMCHACGHDGHAAMLLNAARIISKNKEKFCGKFIFYFEAEEENLPIKYDINFEDVLKEKKVDAIWGIHLTSFMESCKISVQKGPRMTSQNPIDIEIIGRGGHGSRPDLSINPVVAAAEVITKLQMIPALYLPPEEVATLAITVVNGGVLLNVIPDTCVIKGNARTISQRVNYILGSKIRQITDSICQANGCRAEYKSIPDPNADVSVVINDPQISAIAEKSLDKILPGSRVEEGLWMASESFGRYQKVVPGVFAFVGIRNEELGSGAEHHNSKFDIDEKALIAGTKATIQFAFDFLNQ